MEERQRCDEAGRKNRAVSKIHIVLRCLQRRLALTEIRRNCHSTPAQKEKEEFLLAKSVLRLRRIFKEHMMVQTRRVYWSSIVLSWFINK